MGLGARRAPAIFAAAAEVLVRLHHRLQACRASRYRSFPLEGSSGRNSIFAQRRRPGLGRGLHPSGTHSPLGPGATKGPGSPAHLPSSPHQMLSKVFPLTLGQP